MCGITGKVSRAGPPVTSRDIQRMNRAVAHRGPDASGIYVSRDGRVGLGHQRLSIIDLSKRGHQPMRYLDRYMIVFNGEIYNFQHLRARLVRAGYTFKSETDTEVILALYDQLGEACVEQLRGMFAFAIYDEQTDRLFCARDRLGKKPFKYFFDGRIFIFGSELKSILTQPQYARAPDLTAIHHYLTYQYCPAPWTGFRDIQKLQPAHALMLDCASGKLAVNRYWQLAFHPRTDIAEHEWITALRDKLSEAVRLRLIADVPLGAFLSGGTDSSAIVALMARLSPQPVKTFSIGFTDHRYNELSYARQVANTYKTEHVEFVVKPHALDVLPELVRYYEEPYADSSAVPTYHLSQLTRRYVTVALNGDGGDENFAGYSRYNIQKFALLCDRLGLNWVQGASKLLGAVRDVRRTTFWNRAHRFTATLKQDYRRRYVNYICYFTDPMKATLYTDNMHHQLAVDSAGVIAAQFSAAGTANKLDQTLYADMMTYLPDDLLVKVDIASMACALEARSPFLDHEFVELAAQVPFNYKLHGWRQNKFILKKMLRGLVPDAVMDRPKMGFVVPIEAWFREDLEPYVRSILIDHPSPFTAEYFRPEAIADLLDTHTKTKINLAPPIWALLTLDLWYREYFA